jgi:membrane-associated phospholipid phosphatase
LGGVAPRAEVAMVKGSIYKKLYTSWFLIPALVLFLAATIISLLVPRETIHLAINSLHSPFLDRLFRMWTLMGSGLGALVIILVTLMVRIRYTLMLSAGYAISGIASQLIKHLFFSHTPRPLKYFALRGLEPDLHLVPGVDLHSWYSFPSGHSATAFALFFGLSLILESRWAQLLALVLAAGVAYSRIYMSQHFLIDVVGGAVTGMAGGYLGWWWIGRYDREWLDKSLPKLISG